MSSNGEDRLGSVLGGRYELRDVIASGAQGYLYRAKDLKDGDDVAIKVLRNAEHALAVDRERRFQTCPAMWNALKRCLSCQRDAGLLRDHRHL